MSKHLLIISGLLIVLGFSFVNAQNKQMLSQKDIETILKILPEFIQMVDQLDLPENLSEQEAPDRTGEMQHFLKFLQTQDRVRAFFPKYGMSLEQFMEKYGVMMDIYGAVMAEIVDQELYSKMAESMAIAKEDSGLSQEERERIAGNFEAARNKLRDDMERVKQRYHPADIELIRKNLEKIDEVFQRIEENEMMDETMD